MTAATLSVVVSDDGAVSARSWEDGGGVPGTDRVDLSGLEGRLLRLFERWLADRSRVWSEEEIRVFGQLLHRQLFPREVWSWVCERVAREEVDVTRLMLRFPVDAASSRLAALPWEFLCAPDRPGVDGRFLALTPRLMLSRSVPPGTPPRAATTSEEVRILPVVGDAHNDWLGEVDYEPVLEAITRAGERPDFVVLDAGVEVTERRLAALVAETRPHVVHYLGHGRFDDQSGRGAVALRADEGGTAWVDEDRLARALCTDAWAPTLVVLHACEGGRTDYEYRHAGLAPGLVRAGAHCVVAMQYPVTNETAIEFSTTMYDALAHGAELDQAVQRARQRIWDSSHDARLLGVPMIYQRSAARLLAPADDGGEP